MELNLRIRLLMLWKNTWYMLFQRLAIRLGKILLVSKKREKKPPDVADSRHNENRKKTNDSVKLNSRSNTKTRERWKKKQPATNRVKTPVCGQG